MQVDFQMGRWLRVVFDQTTSGPRRRLDSREPLKPSELDTILDERKGKRMSRSKQNDSRAGGLSRQSGRGVQEVLYILSIFGGASEGGAAPGKLKRSTNLADRAGPPGPAPSRRH